MCDAGCCTYSIYSRGGTRGGGGGGGGGGWLTSTLMIHFFKSHIWNPEVLNFTNFFVPRANSCPIGLLFGHLGSHIEFPLDSKNRGKIGVGVTILIITSVILIYFQQMRYQNKI